MPPMASLWLRSKLSSQSQDSHGTSTISCPPTSLPDSKTSAYAKMKGAHPKTPHSSTSSTNERELSCQLLRKEAENEELRTYYQGKASQRENHIRNLVHGQTILREASEKKDSDMLKRSKRFQATLDEKDKKFEELRGNYNRLLHAKENQQRNSRILQRNADAKAEALREKLTTTEQELELCRDDLFRLQPVCLISDGSIMAAFESLSEELVNWIDNETSDFENAYPDTPVAWLFSGSKDPDVACFLQMYPLGGEYLCRSLVNRCLSEDMFGTNAGIWGLSAEYTNMQLKIEDGMSALKPPRGTAAHFSVFLVLLLILSDSQTINIWRAETLSALGSTQEYKDLREEQGIQWTKDLFNMLSASCPNLFGGTEVMKRFHDQVTIPAIALVSQLQGLASPYKLGMVNKNLLSSERFTKDNLSEVVAVDLETGKTLKPGSAIVSDRKGVIGNYVLPLEPSLHRVNEGTKETELRQETWLVKLDHALGGRAPRGD